MNIDVLMLGLSQFAWLLCRSSFLFWGFLGGTSGKESTCQFKRHKRLKFNPWVGKIPWRGKWHSTPVLLPGKSHGQSSLMGYSPWGHKESDTAEVMSTKCLGALQGVLDVWEGALWFGRVNGCF